MDPFTQGSFPLNSEGLTPFHLAKTIYLCLSSPDLNNSKRTMPLVDYSSSSEDDAIDGGLPEHEPKQPTNLKRKRPIAKAQDLPPLPASFYDLYASNTRVSTSDDPSLHGGRKRHVPHVEGNWPSHVYLECKLDLPCCIHAYCGDNN
jgi:hypothetical protein